ncbi:glycine cleavage system protein GcvH [Ruminococcaceae bacterium OttesenSCG-928-I18]|nr:glycine cleavage system protein GcvH [Ruminococcaceae bacterium OttesenSCG-928-I18]
MQIKSDLSYTKNHEWVEKTSDGKAKIGITDYAQSELGDLVFINLPQVGDALSAGDAFADVESVKAVSDIHAPINGTVSAVNEALLDEPELINQDSYAAWFVQVEQPDFPSDLLSAAEYEAFLKEEG